MIEGFFFAALVSAGYAIIVLLILLNLNAYLRRIWKEQQRTNALLVERLPDLGSKARPRDEVERVDPKRAVDHFLPHELRKR